MTRERLFQLFTVDFDSGRFFWRDCPAHLVRLVGREAGCAILSGRRRDKAYWQIKVGGRTFRRSQLMFLALHGRLPVPLADHRDGDGLNDRPSNLREATHRQNAQNIKGRRKASGLPLGVRLCVPSGRYGVRLTIDGVTRSFGAFSTPEEASAVYVAKRAEFFGEFA